MSYPKTVYYIGPTRLCSKRVGRSLGRGDRPTELSYSWLPKKWIEVQPHTPQAKITQHYDNEQYVRVIQRGYSPFEKGNNLHRRLRIIFTKITASVGLKAAI